MRIRSCSTSARPPRTATIKRRVPVSAHGSTNERNCAFIHDTLDDTEEVKGAARQPIDARHHHHVTGGEVVEHAEKLARRHLFAVDVPAAASGGAELVELSIEG